MAHWSSSMKNIGVSNTGMLEGLNREIEKNIRHIDDIFCPNL